MTGIPSTVLLSYPSAGKPDDYVLRLSVAQHHAMIRGGVLGAERPVELLDGYLVVKIRTGPEHAAATDRVRRALDALLPPGLRTRVREPVTLADGEPEPDVAVVRGTDDHYTDRHPGPTDVPLVVEVALRSVERDRTLKLRCYARAGIGVYWIVNLDARQVEVYTSPLRAADPAVYARPTAYLRGDVVLVAVDGNLLGCVPVVELLP